MMMNNNNISLEEFVRKYARIKYEDNIFSFPYHYAYQIKDIQYMINKGYELKFIHGRRNSKIMWVKNNNK